MYVKNIEHGKRTYTYIFACNFLNIKWIQSEKSFGKLRLRAFQPSYVCQSMLKMLKVEIILEIFNILWHT